MRDQAMAIDEKLVTLALPAENWMVIEHQARLPLTSQLLEGERGCQTTDAPTDNDAVIGLVRVDRTGWKALEFSISNPVAGVDDCLGVAVGIRVIADAAVASPIVRVGGRGGARSGSLLGQQLCRR